MKQFKVTFMPSNITVLVEEGMNLLQAQIQAGLRPDAPCGGKGTCGKCKVMTQARTIVLACQTIVDEDLTIVFSKEEEQKILKEGIETEFVTDGTDRYVLAFDIGTTTVVGYLMDGRNGEVLASSGRINPQCSFGADVISRIQYVLEQNTDELKLRIREALHKMTIEMAEKVKIAPEEITVAAIVGNTAMHHLLLGIDPKPLVTPPYMPAVFDAMERMDKDLLPIGGSVRILGNIAGFVGGDTLGCMVAAEFDRIQDLTLLIDIGTNGEMVLGNQNRRIACSTAAGPAFEGAKISCGMRGVPGAIDHVYLENGEVAYHVIGEQKAIGICGSGLLDLVAVLLETGVIDETGHLEGETYPLTDLVVLTQKDVREVQLAKAAIRAGIELLAEKIEVELEEIRNVFLAGAFGNYMNPASACRIGMIPPSLEEKIKGIGNAAGEGAKHCALKRSDFERSMELAKTTEFLELASIPAFQDRYVDALMFEEDEE